ncbi:unnamed protein product [Schistosoma margrebowiei]|uniref:UBX domain-containing protein n=1 Tax=Schistosoma margrebowiei TaxID=48269 RepID=A0AA85AMX1_9TREM|nr:unnamed protein product [Schistosoma margrebowiei]
MDRDTMLENFLACTGLTDITYAISILEDHNWDLTAAVSSIISDVLPGSSVVQEDQSVPYSTVFPMTPLSGPILSSESSINHNLGTQTVSVSTMCDIDTDISGCDISPAISRSVIELDSDQATINSNRAVRILNFEIDLELPMDDDTDHEQKVVKESFPFPDTETVGFLKQHFIDCRLTELIQLATSPELESKITECSKANLLKHLVLESSGSHSFSDNSTLLRALHLPKCIKLRARLNPDPLPYSNYSNQQNGQVVLHVSVYKTSDNEILAQTTTTTGKSSSSCCDDDDNNNYNTKDMNLSESNQLNTDKSYSPYAYHYLRLPCDSYISKIHNDLHRITGIPITNQLWSIKSKHNRNDNNKKSNRLFSEQIPSNEVLNSLVNELNRHYSQQLNKQSFKTQSILSKHSNVTSTINTNDDNVAKQKSSHDNVTLADCGLKSGDVCDLCLTASNPLNHKNPSKAQLSHNTVDTHSESLQQRAKKSSSHSLDDNIPSGSSTATTTTTAATDVLITETSSTRNKSNRKISSSKKPNYRNISPEIGFDDDYDNCNDDNEEEEDDEDYDMDYHYSSDEILDETDDKKITPWNQPLIPDDPSFEDPELAAQQFCIVFLQRYCRDGVTMSPPFSTCSLETALSLSVGTSQVCDRKPLFIYLHNDASVACHVFCQQVLCSSGLLRFLTDHDFSLWPWDITHTRNRERLFGWLEVKLPNLSRIITSLTVDSYPILAMIVKLSSQLEVLCIVMGTGIVKMWPPIDHFPPLLNVRRSSSSHFTSSSTTTVQPMKTDDNSSSMGTSCGSLKPDVIVAELWQAYTTYLELLEPECAAEREIIARRRVLEEQEAAYEESLRRDQEKEWERAKAKAEEDKRKQLEEEKRINDEIKATQHRLFMAASLPPEPPTPKTPAAEAFLSTPNGVDGITTLRFRLPPQCSNDPNVKHSTMIRRFAGSDILKHVFMFMESKGYSKSDYKLFTTYPIRDLTLMDENMTLANLDLVPQETLTLELR